MMYRNSTQQSKSASAPYRGGSGKLTAAKPKWESKPSDSNAEAHQWSASSATSARRVEPLDLPQVRRVVQDASSLYKAPTEAVRPDQGFIPLIDPTGFGGLIQVPAAKVLDTIGRTEYFQGILKKEVSLCCLFQKGRCHAAEKCHQIHVDQAFMRFIRTQNANVISCCREHKDTASLSSENIVFWAMYLAEGDSHISIVRPSTSASQPATVLRRVPAKNISFTTALAQLAKERGTIAEIPVNQICKLHLRGGCKYAKDCKRIHFCSKLGEGLLSETADVEVIPKAAAPRPVTPVPVPERKMSNDFFSRASNTTSPQPALDRSPSQASVGGMTDCAIPSNRTTPRPQLSFIAENENATDISALPQPLPGFVAPPCVGDCASDGAASLTVEDLRCHNQQQAQANKDGTSLRHSELLNNLSFMDTSVKLQGLCFDPELLSQPRLDDFDAWSSLSSCTKAPNTALVDWSDNLSSTRSQQTEFTTSYGRSHSIWSAPSATGLQSQSASPSRTLFGSATASPQARGSTPYLSFTASRVHY